MMKVMTVSDRTTCTTIYLAFRLLIKSTENHYDCARVWLRIAECCIARHYDNEDFDQQPIINEIGEGCARLVIANSVITNTTSDDVDSLEPSLSLPYASLCLENAIALCPSVGKDHPEYTAVTRLYAAILTAAAWVALNTGDYSRAVDYAEKCRQLNLSNAYSLLADLYLVSYSYLYMIFHMTFYTTFQMTFYMTFHTFLIAFYHCPIQSESLIHLDRVSDAIDHLKHAIPSSTDVLKSVTLELFSNNSPTSAYPKSCSQAKAIVYSNLAASYCLQNNLERATRQIALVTESIPPDMVAYRTILLAVYILLKEGNKSKALQILRTKNISHFKHSNKT